MEVLDLYNLRINKIIDTFGLYMLRNPNIMGVALGNKIINGNNTNNPVLTVYVGKKLAKSALNSCDVIPQNIKGVYTDIIESGEFKRSSDYYTSYHNNRELFPKAKEPAKGGGCIFFYDDQVVGDIHSATMTYAVTERNSKANIYYLTTGHIGQGVKNVNSFTMKYVRSLKLSTEDEFELGKLTKVSNGYWSKELKGFVFEIEAAIGRVGPNNAVTRAEKILPGLVNGTIIKGTQPVLLNDSVYKYGISTQLTKGIVTNTNGTFKIKSVADDTVFENFREQIVVKQPSSHGDSGALGVVEKTDKAFGMLNFASSKGMSIYSKIDTILDRFNMDLLT